MPRSAILLVVACAATLTLTGCGVGIGGGAPTPSISDAPSPSASPSPTPIAKPTAAPLPADTLIHATTTVSQANGAKLALSLIVHAPVPWNSTAGTPMSNSMATSCDGTVDKTVFGPYNYSFVEIDVTATAVRGPAWGTVPVGISPVASPDANFALSVAGGVTQVQILGPTPGPGDYVPTCLQPAAITGPGSGKVYLGYGTDISGSDPTIAWASDDFGFRIGDTADGSTPVPLTFSGCTTTVTTLGTSSVPGHNWTTGSDGGTECIAFS